MKVQRYDVGIDKMYDRPRAYMNKKGDYCLYREAKAEVDARDKLIVAAQEGLVRKDALLNEIFHTLVKLPYQTEVKDLLMKILEETPADEGETK
jgi:hypothetical protein